MYIIYLVFIIICFVNIYKSKFLFYLFLYFIWDVSTSNFVFVNSVSIF